MVAKLKSVLQNPILQLAFKPLLFGGLLFLVWLTHFNLLALLLFLGLNFLLYTHPLLKSLSFLSSFLILILLSILSLFFLAGDQLYLAILLIVVFTVLFYLILGLKNLQIRERDYWYYLIHLSLFYLTFLNFFIDSDYFWLKLVGVFLISLFLLKELLKLFKDISSENNLFYLVISLIITELVWIISWLPIGFLSATNLIFTTVYFSGLVILGKKNLTIFLLLLLLIFFSSGWQINTN